MAKFCVLIPFADAAQFADDVRISSLERQTLTDWHCFLLPAGTSASGAPVLKRDHFDVGPAGLDTFAKLLNYATESGHGDYLLPLPAGIELEPDTLEKFASVLDSNPGAAGVFSSYREKAADGSTNEIKLYPHEGAIHERFDFGFLKAYRASHLKEVGGARADLAHAAEYDLDLRLGDKYSFELVDEYLYNTVQVNLESSGGLHSPGKGKLGGFSYIFYPPGLEKEVTGVFEEMLNRRGAWIDRETVNVPYPAEPYPILASVIIPVLNRASFIGNAIDRVLEGTFKDFEVLIIDNASTDGTQDVVRQYAEKDPRVRLIQRGGGTIASALNEGIRQARGKYICQLDSDDEYTPDTLELMVGHMESHPKCGLAISYYGLMDENRKTVEGIDPITHSGYTRNQILRRDGAGALRVFPKVVLEEMGYYDEENFGNFGEDYDMVLKTGEKYDVDRVHKVLYRYRRHSDNTDVTRDPLMKIQNKNNARLNALKRRQKLNQNAK